MIGQPRNSCNVLVRMLKEDDFISVMARGNSEMLGSHFRVFHGTPYYLEDEDSPWAPVWLTLPGLPPNYFQESMLRSIGNGFGRYLK